MPARRYETIQWLMFQMGGIGPMFGQVGFFHKFAGKDFEDKRPRDRYVGEAKRLLGVLEQRLAGRAWIMGDDYTIADIATFPWVRNLVGFYGAGELVGIDDFPHVHARARRRSWRGRRCRPACSCRRPTTPDRAVRGGPLKTGARAPSGMVGCS